MTIQVDSFLIKYEIFAFIFLNFYLNLDATSVSSNSCNAVLSDFTDRQPNSMVTSSSRSNTGKAAVVLSDMIDNINNYSIIAEINDFGRRKMRIVEEDLKYFYSGVCCEKGEEYVIYIISVSCKSLHIHGNNVDDQRHEWITYRRYSEFIDLDITIKKLYPDLRTFLRLPNTSLVNNTSSDIQLKLRTELNNYLSVRMIIILFLFD